MKKKRNRRGSAPSSCAPASCPTSSSSRVLLAHTGPFPPSPSLFVAALCHTVHPRAHLSRDLANHRSLSPNRTALARIRIIGRKKREEERASTSFSPLVVAAASWSSFPSMYLSSPLPQYFPFSSRRFLSPRGTIPGDDDRLSSRSSPRSVSSCHPSSHRRGSHDNDGGIPREIFVLAAAPTDAGLLQSAELLGELIFERRQRHSGIWWHRPPLPPPSTPPTDHAQSRHQGVPCLCLVPSSTPSCFLFSRPCASIVIIRRSFFFFFPRLFVSSTPSSLCPSFRLLTRASNVVWIMPEISRVFFTLGARFHCLVEIGVATCARRCIVIIFRNKFLLSNFNLSNLFFHCFWK